ncbi:ribonuclease domain-containing protein [Agrilutibacter solisilvae]|nr:ribonuclease domain-containing protein [Lysobacter solisilvae]
MNKTIAIHRRLAGALTTALMLCALPAAQAAPPACKGLHTSVKEAMRTMSVCITMNNPPADCNHAGMDVQRFNNDEKKLPKASPPQEYWEGKLRDGGAAGTWRLVYLVTMGTTKNKVDARYFTNDHYASFCKIN